MAEDKTLWSVHLIGPDELICAPSYEAAAKRSIELTEGFLNRFREKLLTDQNMPWVIAVPTPWLYDADRHAEHLADNPEMTA